MEDLDLVTASRAHEAGQLADLAAIGLDWDGEVVRQSERFALYFDAIDTLRAQSRLYECYCSRREIREAAQAPNAPLTESAYPGTCRTLTAAERQARVDAGRRPALRLRAEGASMSVDDRLRGTYSAPVDDFVVCRNDGVPAYNLAVVIDDHLQGVTEVVRGDDLLSSTPRQLLIMQLLGIASPSYAHVPLVFGPDGTRLAKRHGAVTLRELGGGDTVRRLLCESLGLDPADPLRSFDPDALPREPWVFTG